MGCYSPSQVTPPPAFSRVTQTFTVSHLHRASTPLGGERHWENKVSCSRTQHKWPRSGLEPGPVYLESSMLTNRPPRLATNNDVTYFNLFQLCLSKPSFGSSVFNSFKLTYVVWRFLFLSKTAWFPPNCHLNYMASPYFKISSGTIGSGKGQGRHISPVL